MEHVDLYTLSASQEVVRTVLNHDVETVLNELREWLRGHGYTPLGPALLGWDELALRQVRQPIAPVFAPDRGATYRVVERPEMLVVAASIPVRNGKYNLAGVYDQVQRLGFDPLGAPYVPLLAGVQSVQTSVRGFVPVVPRGTSRLLPLPSWFANKMGWQLPPLPLGETLSARLVMQQTGLLVLRALIAVLLLGIVALPLITGAELLGVVVGEAMWPHLVQRALDSALGFATIAGLGLIGFGLLMLRSRLRAMRCWNTFWERTPTPPLLVFDFMLEEIEKW